MCGKKSRKRNFEIPPLSQELAATSPGECAAVNAAPRGAPPGSPRGGASRRERVATPLGELATRSAPTPVARWWRAFRDSACRGGSRIGRKVEEKEKRGRESCDCERDGRKNCAGGRGGSRAHPCVVLIDVQTARPAPALAQVWLGPINFVLAWPDTTLHHAGPCLPSDENGREQTENPLTVSRPIFFHRERKRERDSRGAGREPGIRK